jgi:outer membrane biosynthesis protein TonB
MGLLDDAIREHLDLKRKHGAGEDEIHRQEAEALGPARRDFAADAGQGGDGAVSATAPAEVEPEPEPVASEPAGWLDEEPGAAPFDPVVEPPEPAHAEDPLPAEEPLPAPDPAPAAEAPAAPARRESQTPTQGFDALSVDDEPPAEGDEDVLEETPDFLQDTPEHDRLWFEQKPPRDFDFDG